MKNLLYILTFLLMTNIGFSQGLSLKGAIYVTLKSSVQLVINEQAVTGIKESGTTGGIINSDNNENDYVKWVIKNGAAGNYIIPWMSTELTWIPFTYSIGAIGSNDGSVSFSTWRTGTTAATKTALGTTGTPAGVTNMNGGGTTDALNAVNRFWWVKFSGYATPPAATLTFTYCDPQDLTGTNITGSGGSETNLQAQYWNSGWKLPGMGTDVPANNVVTTGITSQTTNAPWALALSTSPLPIELLSFSAVCQGDNVILNWVTASETNNDYFTIERSITPSPDGEGWGEVATVPGAGNSNTTLYYSYTDNNPYPETSYYRLEQTDFNGQSVTFNPVAVSCENNSPFEYINIYPNPATGNINCEISLNENTVADISIINVLGQRVISEKANIIKGENHLLIDVSTLAPAPYYFKIETSDGLYKDCKQILIK